MSNQVVKKPAKPSFTQTHSLERRIKIVEQAKLKNPNSVVVVIERLNKYQRQLPQLWHSRFIIDKTTKLLEILQAVRDRLIIIDKNSADEALNLIIGKSISDYNVKVCDIYDKYKNKQDNILYIKYSNLDAY